MAFTGFSTEVVPWFDGLALDNSKAYFTANREVYEQGIRQPLNALLVDLAAEFGGGVKLFRPNRDVRFSADKSLYKTSASGHLMGRPDTGAGFYVAVSADGLFAATGYYQMAKDQVARFREALTGDDAVAAGVALHGALDALLDDGFEVDGDEMKVRPRGVTADAPNQDLLRYRSVTASANLAAEKMVEPSAREWVAAFWRAAKPMNAWLDEYVGDSLLPPEERPR